MIDAINKNLNNILYHFQSLIADITKYFNHKLSKNDHPKFLKTILRFAMQFW
jgi:hypothetical protein